MLFISEILPATLSDPNVFWTAISAIGTVAAVIVSLYLASRSEQPRRKLDIQAMTTYHFSDGKIIYTVTIDNLGNRNIILVDYGFNDKGRINTSFNYLLKKPLKPITIQAGDSVLIQYEYDFGHPIGSDESTEIAENPINRVFRKGRFIACDSTNKLWHQRIV